jgi:predicted lipid carrier protein YhbT
MAIPAITCASRRTSLSWSLPTGRVPAAVKLAERAVKVLGKTPEQTAFDGGFSARGNLVEIEDLGIRDVVFSKAPGLSIRRDDQADLAVSADEELPRGY